MVRSSSELLRRARNDMENQSMKNFVFLSLLAAAGFSGCGAAASSPRKSSESLYAILGVSTVDVEKGTIILDQTVLISDDRIEKIGSRAEVKIPGNAALVDGHGLYLMPGLVDAHVHYFEAPVFGRALIANGVLLVRDMGMSNEYILPLRDQLNRGEILGPEMIATGVQLDGAPAVIPSIAVGLSTPEEGRLAVRRQAEAGVDMIKVYSKLERDVFLAILDEAKQRGLKVAGHVPDSIYIEEAAQAGLLSSEHWFGFEKIIARLLGDPVPFIYTGMGSQAGYLSRLDEVNPADLEEVYRRLRASGLTVVPTVVTFKDFPNINDLEAGNFMGSDYISPALLSMWKTQWAAQDEIPDVIWQSWAQMVNGLNRAGVPLMVGTDLTVPGMIPGYSVHEEMAIWQEAGIPARDILRSATLTPVRFMGLEERLGSIQEGKVASMLLVRGNPLEDIRNAGQIESVFLRGRYFSRGDLDRLLEEARDLAQVPIPG